MPFQSARLAVFSKIEDMHKAVRPTRSPTTVLPDARRCTARQPDPEAMPTAAVMLGLPESDGEIVSGADQGAVRRGSCPHNSPKRCAPHNVSPAC